MNADSHANHSWSVTSNTTGRAPTSTAQNISQHIQPNMPSSYVRYHSYYFVRQMQHEIYRKFTIGRLKRRRGNALTVKSLRGCRVGRRA